MPSKEDYLKTLRERAAESKVYARFQLDGLEIAQILGDEKHKALYIKLAKEGDAGRLRQLALSVAENPKVKSKGAYFMAVAMSEIKRKKKNVGGKRKNTRRRR